jgi:hypothetical protein
MAVAFTDEHEDAVCAHNKYATFSNAGPPGPLSHALLVHSSRSAFVAHFDGTW